jgi:hypothetical protein
MTSFVSMIQFAAVITTLILVVMCLSQAQRAS